MPKFRVLVPITGFVAYVVNADNPEDARDLILDGDCECDNLHSEYNGSCDKNDYTVEELQ